RGSPMPTCTCPACQAQFQAAADRGAFASCPECRFRVRVPELAEQSPAAPVPGMITCECGRCRMKFQVMEEKAGTTQRCPECAQAVRVFDARPYDLIRRASNWALVAVVLLILGLVLSEILDYAGRSALGTVGASIGTTTGN